MFKKTMFVVGALIAATISMPGAADAMPHHAYFHRVRSGAAAVRHRRPIAYRPRVVAFRHVPYRSHAVVVRTAAAGYRGRVVHRRFGRAFTWWHPYAPHAVAAAAPAGLAAPTAAAPAAAVSRRGSGVQTGRASFYGGRSRTASGGFVGAATCAHRSLPFGTRVLVTNLANARRAVLTVNDRGPFVSGRIVDVSTTAAGMLGMLHSGTAPVRVQVVGGPG